MNENSRKRLVENYELRIDCDEMEARHGERGFFLGYYPSGEKKVAFVPLPEDFVITDVDNETGEVALSQTGRDEILLHIFWPQVVEYQTNMSTFRATIVDKIAWSERLKTQLLTN